MVPVLVLLLAVLVSADDLSAPAESVSPLVVHCDSSNVCPDGMTCCRSAVGKWFCCPFTMGQCCRDGYHCCQHGYHCDSTSTRCLKGWMRLSASSLPTSRAIQKSEVVLMDEALEWQNQVETVQCDENVSCPADKFCCKTQTGQWGCCSGLEL